MKSFWDDVFVINDKEYKAEIYNYKKSIALKGDFTKYFSEEFKKIGGRFNKFLDFTEEEPPKKEPGWIFRKESIDLLNQILKDISEGKIKPSDVDTSKNSLRIYNKLQELLNLIDESEDVYQLSEHVDIYLNPKVESEELEGDTIYSLESSKKKMYIQQKN